MQTTIERMRDYIQRTKMSEDRYQLNLAEIRTLGDMIHKGDLFNAICLAYDYGKAKGVHMAKRRK